MPVDFALSTDQEAIADAFRAFFTNESPIEVVRATEDLGFSPELWAKLRAMDATGMAAPAEKGGGEAMLSELLVVAETLGAAIAPVPLIEHWVASRLLPETDIVSGERVAALALRPTREDGTWRLVPGGAVADVVVGVDGEDLVAVSSEPPMAAPLNHASAALADRSARSGDRAVLGAASDFAVALDEWRTLTAGALVGLSRTSLAIGLEYVHERHQFGRAIGTYQVIQHGLADLPALIDGADFLAHKAAWAEAEGLVGEAGVIDMVEGNVEAFEPLAAMAFLEAAEAAAVTTDRSLHYHGGYGFSLEYDIQLFFRRARGWANVIGDQSRERLRLADLLWGAR